MKTKRILLALLTIFVCTNALTAQSEKTSTTEKVCFNVAMDCHSCQQKIEKNIAFEKGVKALDVSLEKQTVVVTYDSRKTNVESLQSGFKKIGYEAKVVAPEESKNKGESSK